MARFRQIVLDLIRRLFPRKKVHIDDVDHRHVRDKRDNIQLDEVTHAMVGMDPETGEIFRFGTWEQDQIWNGDNVHNGTEEFNDDVEFNDPVVVNDTLNVNDGAVLDEGIVVNESGGNNDTRMEGDTEPNLFFLDAGNDLVGIGTDAPFCPLDIDMTGVTILKIGAVQPFYLIANMPTMGLNLYYDGGWKYGHGSVSRYGGVIDLRTNTGQIRFGTSTLPGHAGNAAVLNMHMFISRTGEVSIGHGSPAKTFDVKGDITLEAGSGDYYSNDGSQGWTGTFTNGDGDTVTVKNGIITDVS